MENTIYVANESGDLSAGFYTFKWDGDLSFCDIKNMILEVFRARGKSYNIHSLCSSCNKALLKGTFCGIDEIMEWADKYIMYKKVEVTDYQIKRTRIYCMGFSSIYQNTNLECSSTIKGDGAYWENHITGSVNSNMITIPAPVLAQQLKWVLQEPEVVGKEYLYYEDNSENDATFYTQKCGIELKRISNNDFALYKLERVLCTVGTKLVAVD